MPALRYLQAVTSLGLRFGWDKHCRRTCCLRLLAREGSKGGRLDLEIPFDNVELIPIIEFLDANKVAWLLFMPDRPRLLTCH